MSTSNQTAGPSSDNFSAVFNAASSEYQRVTGNRLDTHPIAAQLDTCNSPQAISNLLQIQVQAFSKFRKGDEKLMAWLDPIVHIICTFSATLGNGIGLPFSPANTIFTGISVLLGAVRDVVASHKMLVQLFERIHCFLQRLNIYVGISLTNELTELLGKIMAQLLYILALSTKAMTQRRIKKFLKKLIGRTDVEDALLRLDSLTKEESLMTVARNLELIHHVDDVVRDVDGNVKEATALTKDVSDNVKVIDNNVKETKDETHEIKRNQLREKFRTWLSPPDPSINHNTACETHHRGTATWFIQGSTFREWKENGSLLWIRGNPGAGKSILCSAIIEDIKNIQEDVSALIAYYYFDFKDASKRDIRGLLTSLLLQLGDRSDRCWDVLYQLYTKCSDGSEQPSDAALIGCLETMLKLPEQVPIFVILDALDECPNVTGTPSAREKVLDFVEELVGPKHPNLFICITSRPEQDIQAVLNPLTREQRRVSLHEERGQREDINNYVRAFVFGDRTMRRWREEDKELIITTLSERAGGMFRWVFCQLDTLRRCMPSSLRKALNELPTTLDDTYERALEGIPKEKQQHAHRLFQCLVAAIRPFRVEELAEIFTIEFDQEAEPNLLEGWRPDNAEEAVLSACSTLISIIDQGDSKVVQFSHFSVKEFLTSDRLRKSDIGSIRQYYISLDAAHTLLARACLAVLLQLDETVDKKRLMTFLLAFYAADHWVDHAKFEDVASRVEDAMKCLFNLKKPYLAAWAWIHDIDRGSSRELDALPEHPSPPDGTALYYAVLCGFTGLANYLIVTQTEDVNAKCGYHGTPLNAASYAGHVDAARLLLDHGADINLEGNNRRNPLWTAYGPRNLEVMRLLLEHGANADVRYNDLGLISHNALCIGLAEVLELLLRHNADVNAMGSGWTPLHWASANGHSNVAKLFLEYGADVNKRSGSKSSALFIASRGGHLEFVQCLLGHGADVHLRGDNNQTPFQTATSKGHFNVAQLLLAHGAKNE